MLEELHILQTSKSSASGAWLGSAAHCGVGNGSVMAMFWVLGLEGSSSLRLHFQGCQQNSQRVKRNKKAKEVKWVSRTCVYVLRKKVVVVDENKKKGGGKGPLYTSRFVGQKHRPILWRRNRV